MDFVEIRQTVIGTDNVADFVYARLVEIGDRSGDGAGRIPFPDHMVQRLLNPVPLRNAVIDHLLVAGRPEKDRGTVAVPPNQHLHLPQRVVAGLKAAVFIQNQKTEFIACVHRRLLMRIVAGAERVGSHLPAECDLIAADVVGNRFPGQTEIEVGADPFQFDVPSVEEQPPVRRHDNLAESETLFIDIAGPERAGDPF